MCVNTKHMQASESLVCARLYIRVHNISATFCQPSTMFYKKEPQNTDLSALRTCTQVAQVRAHSTRRVYIQPKEPYFLRKEPNIPPKRASEYRCLKLGTCTQITQVIHVRAYSTKKVYIQPKEPYILPKELCILRKGP